MVSIIEDKTCGGELDFSKRKFGLIQSAGIGFKKFTLMGLIFGRIESGKYKQF